MQDGFTLLALTSAKTEEGKINYLLLYISVSRPTYKKLEVFDYLTSGMFDWVHLCNVWCDSNFYNGSRLVSSRVEHIVQYHKYDLIPRFPIPFFVYK